MYYVYGVSLLIESTDFMIATHVLVEIGRFCPSGVLDLNEERTDGGSGSEHVLHTLLIRSLTPASPSEA